MTSSNYNDGYCSVCLVSTIVLTFLMSDLFPLIDTLTPHCDDCSIDTEH